MSRTTWILAPLFLGLSIWLVGADGAPQAPYVPRECPLDSVQADTGVLAIRQAITDADSIADIPEFHDCQRFVVRDPLTNSLRLDSLFAIYRSLELVTITARFRRLPVATGLIAAAVYGVMGDYPQLGIQAGFNCLYLYSRTSTAADPSKYGAKMVPYHFAKHDCADTVSTSDLAAAPGKVLKVFEQIPAGEWSSTDFPAVARWDWDQVHEKQYIGIRCGAAWCHVGDSDLSWSAGFTGSSTAISTQARTYRIKGWYDDQTLAVGYPATLSVIRGVAFPHPALDQYTPEDFANRWRPVAFLAMKQPGPMTPASTDMVAYNGKMGVSPSSLNAPTSTVLNRLFYCRGLWNDCRPNASTPQPVCKSWPSDVPAPTAPEDYWWARIVTSTQPFQSRYLCVYRRGHEDRKDHHGQLIHVPGTVRWRWAAKDETGWARCGEGCCEVDH